MRKITLAHVVLVNFLACTLGAQDFIRIDATFHSLALDTVKRVNVYLPPDYYLNPDMEYPTIYYLHGMSGDASSGHTEALWYYNQHAADTSITSPPAIFVCPDGSCEPFKGSMYVNSALYGDYEDFIMQDIITFVEGNFRAASNKRLRHITGWSMGGFGSAYLSARHSDQFRSCVPCIGYLSMPDTMMNTWRDLLFNENGSYHLNYNAGSDTKSWMTVCGGWSPNPDLEPYPIETPFDTLGNWVDSVLTKWSGFDISRMAKDLPDEHELAWLVIAGNIDYMCFYPTCQVFIDSLEHYNIHCDSIIFNGGHAFDLESWISAIHWIDSIINMEYQALWIEYQSAGGGTANIYPTPARDRITIEYFQEQTGQVRVDLYDLHGKRVLQLLNTHQSQGTHSFTSNISGLPVGTYILVMETAAHKTARKIIKTM